MKNKWGIENFIDLNTFLDPFNEYLNYNTYVFSVEVFVVETCRW